MEKRSKRQSRAQDGTARNLVRPASSPTSIFQTLHEARQSIYKCTALAFLEPGMSLVATVPDPESSPVWPKFRPQPGPRAGTLHFSRLHSTESSVSLGRLETQLATGECIAFTPARWNHLGREENRRPNITLWGGMTFTRPEPEWSRSRYFLVGVRVGAGAAGNSSTPQPWLVGP